MCDWMGFTKVLQLKCSWVPRTLPVSTFGSTFVYLSVSFSVCILTAIWKIQINFSTNNSSAGSQNGVSANPATVAVKSIFIFYILTRPSYRSIPRNWGIDSFISLWSWVGPVISSCSHNYFQAVTKTSNSSGWTPTITNVYRLCDLVIFPHNLTLGIEALSRCNSSTNP